MKWRVIDLQKNSRFGLDFAENGDFSSIRKYNKQIISVSPIHVHGHISIDTATIVVNMTLSGHLELYCAKTLEAVIFPLYIETIECFSLFNKQAEMDYVISDVLDLQPVIEEVLLASIPIQVYADEETIEKANIPSTGKGWLLQTKKQLSDEEIDPRLKKLLQWSPTDEI